MSVASNRRTAPSAGHQPQYEHRLRHERVTSGWKKALFTLDAALQFYGARQDSVMARVTRDYADAASLMFFCYADADIIAATRHTARYATLPPPSFIPCLIPPPRHATPTALLLFSRFSLC